jgi:O-acetylserine/cysteine efflux transporter
MGNGRGSRLGRLCAALEHLYGPLRRYRVDQVAPFILLMPITGMLAGVALLGGRLSAASLTGGAIIVAGLALVIGRVP